MSTVQKFLKPRSLWQILIPYMDYWAVWAEIDHQRHRGLTAVHHWAVLGSGAIHPSATSSSPSKGKAGHLGKSWRFLQLLTQHSGADAAPPFFRSLLVQTDDLSRQWAFCLLTTILILNLSTSFSFLKYQLLDVWGPSGTWLIVGDLLDEVFRRSGQVWYME